MTVSDVILVFQILATCIQGVATIGVLATLIVYFLQLRTMQDQLKASRDAAAGQNLLTLIGFLQNEEVRDARRAVIRTLGVKPFSKWTEEDERVASKVCGNYDVAGIIIREDLAPLTPIVTSWGSSIRDCYRILEPYIKEMQKRKGPGYWDDFCWLYEKVKDKRSN
ncbi:MAG: hypothetical protein KJ077_10675 [Anaerolineae bacterium]|nr:hypothetical protein [Anaerolineae bacterium]